MLFKTISDLSPLTTLIVAAGGFLLLYRLFNLFNTEQKDRDKVRLSLDLYKIYDAEFFSRCRREALPFIRVWYLSNDGGRRDLAGQLTKANVHKLLEGQVAPTTPAPSEAETSLKYTHNMMIRDAHRAFHQILGFVRLVNETLDSKLVDIRLLAPVFEKVKFHGDFVKEVLGVVIELDKVHADEYRLYLQHLKKFDEYAAFGITRQLRESSLPEDWLDTYRKTHA